MNNLAAKKSGGKFLIYQTKDGRSHTKFELE